MYIFPFNVNCLYYSKLYDFVQQLTLPLLSAGLYDNDVLESVLEGRKTGVFPRRGGSHSQWRFRRKNLGPGHVFRQRQKQVCTKVL